MEEAEAPVRRRFSNLALAILVGVFALIKIFFDTGSDPTTTWDVVTSAGFAEWPTLMLGVLLASPWLSLAVSLTVVESTVTSPGASSDVHLGIVILGAVFVLLVGGIVFVVPYLLIALGVGKYARRWGSPTWRGHMVGLSFWAFAFSVLIGVATPILDNHAWAPILQCFKIEGVGRDTRVIPLKRDGTAVVGFELSSREVVQAADCRRSSDQSVWLPNDQPTVLRLLIG